MATVVTGEQRDRFLTQLSEIERQLRQKSGYPYDPEKLRIALQDIIEGRFATSDHRFELVNSFDIVVPEDYDHGTRLATFKTAHEAEFRYGYNGAITDENYAKATTKLASGRKLKVKVFQIKGRVTSIDCLAFIKSQRGVLTGAQGASLAYEQGKSQLPVNRWSISFDKKDALWEDADGHHRVPRVGRGSVVAFEFNLGYFGIGWHDGHCLLVFVFCDEGHLGA